MHGGPSHAGSGLCDRLVAICLEGAHDRDLPPPPAAGGVAHQVVKLELRWDNPARAVLRALQVRATRPRRSVTGREPALPQ